MCTQRLIGKRIIIESSRVEKMLKYELHQDLIEFRVIIMILGIFFPSALFDGAFFSMDRKETIKNLTQEEYSRKEELSLKWYNNEFNAFDICTHRQTDE